MVSDNLRTSSTDTARVRVLLVDDTPIIVDRLSRALGTIDGVIIVGVSRSSKQAIGDIARFRPDLIVLDIRLQRSNGWEVLKSVTQSNPKIRIFVFTNENARAIHEQFIAGGASQFFDKSRDFGALYQAVRTLADPSDLSRCQGDTDFI